MAVTGGDRILARLQDIAKRVSSRSTLRVGFLEGATYPDGTPVPLVAAIQEYGAPPQGIPPRPYFRKMVAEKSKGWGKATGDLLPQNDFDPTRTLMQVGEGIKGQLQQSIADLKTPPNAQSTIDRKGFDKPLIDTGHMLNSVDYEVKS